MSALSRPRGLTGTVWLAMTILLALVFLPAPIARAETSLGCLLAGEALTVSGSGASVGSGMGFNVGEVITVEITSPSAVTTTATLYADGDEVASIAVPGTLVYVIEDPAPLRLRVEVDGTATFDFDCAETGDGIPEPSGDPGELPLVEVDCDSGKGYGKHVSGMAKAGEKTGENAYRPGEHRGYSSCIHGEGSGS